MIIVTIIRAMKAGIQVVIYHNLGGNGMITKMKQEIEELHLRKKGD